VFDIFLFLTRSSVDAYLPMVEKETKSSANYLADNIWNWSQMSTLVVVVNNLTILNYIIIYKQLIGINQTRRSKTHSVVNDVFVHDNTSQ
jgi:hypothetical protein